MPPKKAAVPDKPALLGKSKGTLAIGVVGLPNVGKSSLFNIMSKTGRLGSASGREKRRSDKLLMLVSIFCGRSGKGVLNRLRRCNDHL